MGRLRVMFLQACEFDDSIRYAVIALGALDKTSQTSRQESIGPHASAVAGQHYQNALRAYTSAIHFAQRPGKRDLRTALLTSLAIISFEAWYGRHDIALRQIKIGTLLIKEWEENSQHKSISGHSRTAPQDVKTVLLPVFSRLSVQLLSSTGDQTPESPPPLSGYHEEDADCLPSAFDTLEEAREFQDIILKQLLKFISKGQSPIPKTASNSARSYPSCIFKSPIPLSILAERDALTRTVEKWLSAFAPLKRRLNPTVIEDRKAAIALEANIRGVYMSSMTACAENEMVYDNYYDFYKDMVDLCEAQLKTSRPPGESTYAATVPRFSFPTGVIMCLWSVGHKCRDPALRRRAMSLLLNYPRREGLWNSVFAGRSIPSLLLMYALL